METHNSGSHSCRTPVAHFRWLLPAFAAMLFAGSLHAVPLLFKG